MTKKVNKKNAIVLILVLLVVGLIYWAYASRPKVEETQNTQTNKVMVYHNNTLKEEVNGKLIWQCYAETMTVDQDSQMFTMEKVKGTFYREDGYIRLQPENDTMDPILVQETQLHILGKVIGVFRFFS